MPGNEWVPMPPTPRGTNRAVPGEAWPFSPAWALGSDAPTCFKIWDPAFEEPVI